jgi:histidinol-phosphate aminotransferase
MGTTDDPLLQHGGTDSQSEPRYDFSSNANALGPCPYVLRAAKRADLTRYPDPHYRELRSELARAHGAGDEHVVVGAGASELIVRVIRSLPGPVLQLGPSFSEYARGARINGRDLRTARSPDEFLRMQRQSPCVAFLCWPNNPTGDTWDPAFIREAGAQGPLVLDLAYGALSGPAVEAVETAARDAYRLYSPNKAYGVTGIRGAYLVAPRPDRVLAAAAPSWVIGRDAVAMLQASVHSKARAWLAESLPTLHRWRASLAESLRDLQVPVRESPASFLLAEVGEGARVAHALRKRGVRVRDATSFGLERHLRLSAQPPAARRALLTGLRAVL